MSEDPFKNQERGDIRIEIATEKDWQAYRDLIIETLTGEDSYMFGSTSKKIKEALSRTEQDWKNDLFTDDIFVILCWSGSQAIGIGVAVKKDTEGKWHMRSGYVKEGFRGEGIHKRIIEARLDEIRRRGGKKVTTAVKSSNARSIHNAELFGFKKIEEGASEEGFLMELDLTREQK